MVGRSLFLCALFAVLLVNFQGGDAAITRACLQGSTQSSTAESLKCLFCATPRFSFLESLRSQNASIHSALCDSDNDDEGIIISRVSRALLDYAAIQGQFWASDELALSSVAFLLKHMPFRDQLLLFQESDAFFNFLTEHVRLALHVRHYGPIWVTNETLLPQDVFMEYVLPYNFLNEKRDVQFNWRPRFLQILSSAVEDTETTTEAMHILADAIPTAAVAGALELNGTVVPGSLVKWVSETSPMRLSPEQVVTLGGASCTGTAIVMAAAARSLGIAARVAGCSQSIPNDDHHWIEFYDPTSKGPFGDYWHTKEGTSAGNAGGPWDAPSAPMATCLKYVVPKDPSGLNTIWAASYSSPRTLPLQWGPGLPQGALSPSWTHASSVGGICRCGAYCGAWGCGKNQTDHYSQKECDVP